MIARRRLDTGSRISQVTLLSGEVALSNFVKFRNDSRLRIRRFAPRSCSSRNMRRSASTWYSLELAGAGHEISSLKPLQRVQVRKDPCSFLVKSVAVQPICLNRHEFYEVFAIHACMGLIRMALRPKKLYSTTLGNLSLSDWMYFFNPHLNHCLHRHS